MITNEFINYCNVNIPLYTTPLLYFEKNTLNSCGCGTFICYKGEYHILTAAHVIEKLNKYDSFFYALKDGKLIEEQKIPGLNFVERKFLDDEFPHPPDVQLLHVNPQNVSLIKRKNLIYNFEMERLPLDGEKTYEYVIVGVPSNLIQKTDEYVDITISVGFPRYQTHKEPIIEKIEDTDCLKLFVNKNNDYHGYSGGAIWLADLNCINLLILRSVSFHYKDEDNFTIITSQLINPSKIDVNI